MSDKTQINQKTINNAISAYFLVFICSMFFFNKDNENLNNDFVKSHTKSALLIQFWFLFIYFLFIYLKLFDINILWFWLNFIITTILLIINLWLLLYWAYNAYLWKEFKIWEIINLWKNDDKIISLESIKFPEKDKLTIILTLVPFLWFLVSPKLNENKIIKNTAKLNLYISLFIAILFIFWYDNISSLFILFYIIFIVFFSILLIIKDEIFIINLYFLLNPSQIEKNIILTFKYLKNYFKKDWFIEFKKIEEDYEENEKLENKKELEILETKKGEEKNKFLVYFPIFNLISVFFIKNSKYKFHMINWIYISLLFILSWLIYWFNNKYQIFLVFIIFYWIWNIKSKINYKIPFIFITHKFLSEIFFTLTSFTKKVKEKRKEEKIINLKVWEAKI